MASTFAEPPTCIYNVTVSFEWDDANRGHVERHGVSTSDCETALNDPIRTDEQEASGEKRWRTIGRVGERRLLVIWTIRGAAIRVVTAWWVGRRTRA